MRDISLVNKARELRDQGWSKRAIASNLGVRSQVVSRWCNTLTNKRVASLVDNNERKRRRLMSKDKINIKTINKPHARLIASLLYWCEGSKYPSSNLVCFTSSDPEMVKLFKTYLEKGYKLNKKKWKVWLQIHNDHNKVEVFDYWSRLLNVPTEQFYKPKISFKKGKKYRNIYHGTCSLKYHDYKIQLRLIGLYKRYCMKALTEYI